MKRPLDDMHKWMEPEVLAHLGAACVVKHQDGRLEIRGGTADDQAQAHAWMKRFHLQSRPLTLRRVR